MHSSSTSSFFDDSGLAEDMESPGKSVIKIGRVFSMTEEEGLELEKGESSLDDSIQEERSEVKKPKDATPVRDLGRRNIEKKKDKMKKIGKKPLKQLGMQKKYKCELCEYAWSSKETLALHASAVHPEPLLKLKRCDNLILLKERSCDKCGHKSLNDTMLKLHSKLVHGKAKPKRAEVELAKDIEKESCSQCSKKYSTKANLKVHIKIRHRQAHGDNSNKGLQMKNACQHCVKTYAKKKGLIDHIKMDKDKECSLCDFATNAAYLQKNHMNTGHHKIVKKKCAKCPMAFPSYSSLRGHTKLVHDGIIHTCPCCPKDFPGLSNLNAHIRKKHSKGSKQ